jgi:hypothetical protein
MMLIVWHRQHQALSVVAVPVGETEALGCPFEPKYPIV